jgi:hypothetical protein
MFLYTPFKRLAGLSTLFLLLLLFIGYSAPASADDLPVVIHLSLGVDDFQPITLGRTIKLSILIVNNSDHLIRANSFNCTQHVGESFRVESVSRLPGTISPHSNFASEQYYHAVEPGASEVECALTATDTVTGEQFTRTSTTNMPVVIDERRLVVTGYSDTQRITMGQTAHITIVYTNRGTSNLTNITASCPQLGRGIAIDSMRQNYSSLRPNESGFIIFTLKPLFAGGGGLFLCQVQATDTATNQVFKVPVAAMAVNVAS